MMHAEGTAAGNSAGTSDSSSSYGSPAFRSTLSVVFRVDGPVTARFFGTAISTSAGGGSSGLAQILFADLPDGTTTSATTILAQPTSNLGLFSFDTMIPLDAGHRYTFTITTTASTNRTFATGPGSASSDVTFTALIPTPPAAALLTLGALTALRRRR
jgi:hypothetical protein